MKIVFLGAPGSGKGTQIQRLLDKFSYFKLVHISTGNILRQHIKDGTELGQLAQSYLEQGQLVPDEVIIDLVRGRLSQPDVEAGFILDGFPRTLAQAEALVKITDLDMVFNLKVTNREVIHRLSGRRTCRECGEIYHVDVIGDWMKCVKCQGELFVRRDDNLKTIANRLRGYRKDTSPLVDFYKSQGILCNVSGKSREEIAEKVQKRFMGIVVKEVKEDCKRIFSDPEAVRQLDDAMAEGYRIGEKLRKATQPTPESMRRVVDL